MCRIVAENKFEADKSRFSLRRPSWSRSSCLSAQSNRFKICLVWMHWATMEATNRKNKNPTLMCVLLRPFLIALFVEICVFQVSCSKTTRHIDRCFMPYISSWILTFFRVHLCGGLPTRLHLYRLNLDMLRNELRINFIYCSFSWISFNQDKMVISFDLTLCSVFVDSIVYRIIRQAFFSLRIVIINIDTAFANS